MLKNTVKGKKYDKFFIYILRKWLETPIFPLKDGDRIEVEIKGRTLIIRKAKEP